MVKLKYIDTRPVVWTSLKFHPGGIELPSSDNIIKCTEGEAEYILRKIKNGGHPCYEKLNESSRKVEKPAIEEAENG